MSQLPDGTALTVLVAGGSGASGIAVARALAAAGHRVATVGSDATRIKAAAGEAGDGVTPFTCDLAEMAGVRRLRDGVGDALGTVDAVIHLVGGWRGATGIADQSDDDWEFLERSAITTLRNVSRVFFDDIAASTHGRFAMVSSTSLDKPTAAVASYVAAKAAAEAWTMAMADGFRKASKDGGGGGQAAAVVLAVKALVDDGLRRKHPERSFPGATDVADLAAAVVRLLGTPAAELNGARLRLAG
ncbi:SDR family NAD(P)-dependent oxidoreductase [Pseudarthrobacter sp. AG30]|uniref:SDR family NAD(P)-dependent oxidoreductase n=1 Tax=unclassified Pseudarthrobacter TaxID=2647000 RepID=UPI000D6E4CC4|nr:MULTISPECIES: SDR family NAD(P)-dependent oxidoreductase [unclassified Pseudarthrobacter]RAX15172.1 SDR family NAD(P)-dependent oxidoreductase [Pseudarthrobacter sp. AG30]